MQTDKIYLVGFMGAGKSSVAAELGRRVDWRVEDVDQRVEARERRSVAEIFAQEGEAYFRGIERAILHELIAHRHTIVATGGGTFVDPVNRSAMLQDGAVVWLDAAFETVIERIPADGRRPLAADRVAMRSLWIARRDAYRQAHYRFCTDSAPVGELVDRIIDRLS